MNTDTNLSPAQKASEMALIEIYDAIKQSKSFKLEAGAGAGKTYSLIKALNFLIEHKGRLFQRFSQRIACITFTNVAKDEILARTAQNPILHCNTIHAFCWSIILGFQSQLRKCLPELDAWKKEDWQERLKEAGGIGLRKIEYTLGHRGIGDDKISLHHNDVLPLTIKMFEYEKFRHIFRSQYPVIFIDEYQDTNAEWIEAIRQHFLGKTDSPLFGFFGDYWQKIYGDGCGELVDAAITPIGKQANFRSVPAIVECLNRMRPNLQQSVVDPKAIGEVYVFHTNGWTGKRKTGSHYEGDLPDENANDVLCKIRKKLTDKGWDFSPERTKILMLTHRVLGQQQGYSSLPSVFKDNSSFTNKEQPHIAFFVDSLEPACCAFNARRYSEMFQALGTDKNYLSIMANKQKWSQSMKALAELRRLGNVVDVIRHLQDAKFLCIPESVRKLERQLKTFDPHKDGDLPQRLKELQKLHEVPYSEIIAVTNYLKGHSPFETQHGVKGAEFKNVLVILGRGWSRYNFNKMLENVPNQASLGEKDHQTFKNNRNLFYVACSRPKKRLALLFTQELSSKAMATIQEWFGSSNIFSAL